MSDPGVEPARDSPAAPGAKRFRLDIAQGAPAAPARHAAARVLGAWGLSGHADDAALVITELVQNVAAHAASACELRLSLHRDVILIEVSDSNPQPPMPRTQDLRRAGGRGLVIIAAVAYRWGHRPQGFTEQPGKVVWAELALRPAD